MAFSFSSMFDELGAKRMRFRGLFGERTTSLIEFILFSGVVLGVFAVFAGFWLGLAPLIALVGGYILLDVNRQNALAKGADEENLRKRQDRLALLLIASMAVLGAGIFVVSMQEPKETPIAPEDIPPPSKLDLEIVQ